MPHKFVTARVAHIIPDTRDEWY